MLTGDQVQKNGLLYRWWPELSLIILIVIAVFTNWFWFILDQFPVEGHELVGHLSSVQIYRDILGLNTTWHNYRHPFATFYGGILYPPLSFLVFAVYYIFAGPSGQSIQMVNALYILGTLVGIFFIGRHIANSRIGLLAAILISAFPGFISFSRQYWVEFGLITYSCLIILGLFKTHYFRDIKASIFLGLSIGLSVLHKYEIIATIIGPALFLLIYSLLNRNFSLRERRESLMAMFIMAITAFIIASWWLIPYGKDMVHRVFFSVTHTGEINLRPPYPFVKNLLLYIYGLQGLLGNLYFGLLLFSILYIAIIILFTNSPKKIIGIILLLWLFCSYIIFTIAKEKGISHIFPLMPAAALLIAFCVYTIQRLVRWVMMISIIVIAISMHISPFFPKIYRIFPFSIVSHIDSFCERRLGWRYHSYHHPGTMSPRKIAVEKTIIETLVFIYKDAASINSPKVISFFKSWYFKNNVFEYYNLERNFDLLFPAVYGAIKWDKGLMFFDYIIVEAGKEDDIYSVVKNNTYSEWDNELSKFRKISTIELAQFELRKEFIIPRSDKRILVYRKKIIQKK